MERGKPRRSGVCRGWVRGQGPRGSQSVACQLSVHTPRPGQGLEAAVQATLSGSGSLGFSGGGSLVGWGSKGMHSGPRVKPCGICGIGGRPGMQQSSLGMETAGPWETSWLRAFAHAYLKLDAGPGFSVGDQSFHSFTH